MDLRHAYAPNTAEPADTWRDRAACRGVDPDVFFPTKSDSKYAERGKGWCTICAVRAGCLDEALAAEGTSPGAPRWGIRGGLTAAERRRLVCPDADDEPAPEDLLEPEPEPEPDLVVYRTPGAHPMKSPEATRHREQAVYRLWRDGLTDRAIAARIGLSGSGVCKIRNRLGLPTHRQLIAR